MKTFTIAGGLAGPPSACSAATDRIDVFAAGPQGRVWQWSGNGSDLAGPTQLPANGSIPAEGVCAIASGPSSVEVFAVDAGSRTPVWWRGNGTTWTTGPALPSGPSLPAIPVAAVAASLNSVDVFSVAADQGIWWWHWNGTAWLAPAKLPSGPNLPAERIAVVSPGPGRLDVFAVGGDTHLWHWWKIGAAAWLLQDLGGNLPSEGVSAVSWGAGRIDVFAASRAPGNPLQHWWSSGGSAFSGPENLGGSLATGSVSAVSHAADRLDVFAISDNGQLAHWQWDAARWSGPYFRGNNIPAGDISAVVRQPHRLDVFFAGAGNTLRKWPGGGLENSSSGSWTNWPTNREKAVDGRLRPDSLEELVDIVKGAEALHRRIRAVGSSWSNSDVAVPGDYVVETDGLGAVLTDVLSNSLNAAGRQMKLVHVEAGIKLHALVDLLEGRGLALKTQGGSTGQSLAGAVSTSVHGMDFDRGPLPDMVRAIHLVGPGGVQHWIEPAAKVITDQAVLRSRIGIPDANIHYDDNWFNSVLVSMGGMGIIYSLILEVEGRYDLIDTRASLDWAEMKQRLRAPGTPNDPFLDSRGVQIVINPYPAGDGSRRCYLTTRKSGPPTIANTGPDLSSLLGFLTPGLMAGFKTDRSTVDDVLNLLTSQVESNGTQRGLSFSVSGGANPGPVKGLTVEVMFDAGTPKYLEFVDAALEIIRAAYYDEPGSLAYLGWISLRYQGRSNAYLSPQYGHERTCSIEFAAAWRMPELPGVGWADTPVLLAKIEAKAREHGGIQHWGMNDAIDRQAVESAYPKVNTWRGVRWALTNNGTLTTFDNAFIERCGLSLPPPKKPVKPPLMPR